MIQCSTLTLLLIAGPPGAGKSTVAGELLRHVCLNYIDTNKCWESLFPQPTYSPDESRRVFEYLCERVSLSLAHKESAIAEGVLASGDRIIRLRRLANEYNASLFILGLRCDIQTAYNRMNLRRRERGCPVVPLKLWKELDLKLQAWRDKEDALWIDSTTITPQAAAEMLVQVLSRK